MLLREKIFKMNQKTYSKDYSYQPLSFDLRKNSKQVNDKPNYNTHRKTASPVAKRNRSFSPMRNSTDSKISMLKEAISTLADSVETELNLIQQNLIPSFENNVALMLSEAIDR